MLVVDGLEVTKDEFRYVLVSYKGNSKVFKMYKDDKVGLNNFICDMIRDYRKENGYVEDVTKHLSFKKVNRDA